MAIQRKGRRLLLGSIVALVLTVAGSAAMGYAWLSTGATRWGDSLIIGPRFTGEVNLDGRATGIRVWREDGVPVLDAPVFAGRGPLYVTFMWGFAVYHTPPGTLRRGKAAGR